VTKKKGRRKPPRYQTKLVFYSESRPKRSYVRWRKEKRESRRHVPGKSGEGRRISLGHLLEKKKKPGEALTQRRGVRKKESRGESFAPSPYLIPAREQEGEKRRFQRKIASKEEREKGKRRVAEKQGRNTPCSPTPFSTHLERVRLG